MHHLPNQRNSNVPSGVQSPKSSSYFTDQKKGEVNELLNLLVSVSSDRNDTKNKKREVLKKVIGCMTSGIDVSRLFSEIVKCVDTKDIILKKMVYLYLTTYANRNSELAIMCINTLLNDCRNEDPMVRGLALRSLCGLRLDSIVEYIQDPLQMSLTDTSSYVRKTGVMGILKVYSLNNEWIKETGMVDTLYNMLRDRHPQVVVNCVVVLNEIMAEEGGMAINRQIMEHLLGRICEFNEWGQCDVLQLLSTYEPESEDEIFQIMNTLEPCLRVSNSAVILATVKAFLTLTSEMVDIRQQVYSRMRQPLLTLLAGGCHEINYAVLHHILIMAQRCPGMFSQEYLQFYARYNEPTYIKYVKIEIMACVADQMNVSNLVMELSEYVTDVDQEMAKLAISSIAQIAVTLEEAAHQVFDALIDLLETDMDYVKAETMVVMKDLLRKYPDDRHDVLPLLPKLSKSVDDPNGQCAIIWMLGEYGHELRRAPYVLEPIIDNVLEETSTAVILELLSASVKLFFKRPPEMQSMLGRLLEICINDMKDQQIHDRALLYYRVLEHDPNRAASVVNCDKEPLAVFAEMEDDDMQEKLISEFNSLSIVYGKPSETFIISKAKLIDDQDEEDSEEHSEYEDESTEEEQYVGQGSDLLDIEYQATAQPSFQLIPNSTMDPGMFQQKWGTLSVAQVAPFQLSTVPAQADIESSMQSRGVNTMASGDTGPQYKFFFYGQDGKNLYYMAETILEKANGTLVATIKADQGANVESFIGELQQAVQSWIS